MDECWITGTNAEQQMLGLQELLVGFSWSFWIFSLLSGLSCYIFHFNHLSFPHFHLSLKFHLQFYFRFYSQILILILILIFFLSPPSTPLLCSIHHHLAPPTLAEWAHKLPSHFTHIMLLVMPHCCRLCPPPWLSMSYHKHTVCFPTLLTPYLCPPPNLLHLTASLMPSKDMGILNTSSRQSLRLFWLTIMSLFYLPGRVWYVSISICHIRLHNMTSSGRYIIHLICIPSRFLGMSIINLWTVSNPLLEVALCCRSSHMLFYSFDGGHLYVCQPVCITSQSHTWVNHPSRRAIDLSISHIFLCSFFPGKTTKDIWASTISPVQKSVGLTVL